MQRADLWSQARQRADAVLKATAEADRVAVFTFDRQLKPLVTFDEWHAISPTEPAAFVRKSLADIKPGWSATRMDEAVVRAAEMFTDSDNSQGAEPRRIVLISDFQEGAKLGALQGKDWPKGIEVVSERVTTKTSNAGLQLLADANGTTASTNSIRVRISNAADSKREQLQVGWANRNGDAVGKPVEVYIPAGQSRIVTMPSPATNFMVDRITLRGDDEAFDNTVFTIPPATSRVSVVYVGDDLKSDSRRPLYFLQRALQGIPGETVEIHTKAPNASLSPDETAATTLYVVTERLVEPLVTALRMQLMQGKTVLFAPTTVEAAATLGNLLGNDRIPVEEIVPRNYAMLGEIDFRHPLFVPFADSRYSDFTKIHFWKYRRIDTAAIPEARIVAKFDNGDAAVIEVPVGMGRLIAFASGWQPADSQLALSTKFIPLLAATLEMSGGAVEAPTQFHVGDTVAFPSDWRVANRATEIHSPGGEPLQLAAGETNFTQTAMPGIYHVKVGNSEKQFAVNLDAAESRTEPLPVDELERLGAPTAKAPVVAAVAADRKVVLQSAELERRQKLWRWFITATLGVLLVETGIAGWTTRRRMLKAEVAA